MHGIFLQIAAGVFPQQRHEQVSGKHLSVVRVAAEGKTGQNLFFDVVVSVAGIYAVPALDILQSGDVCFRFLQGFVFVVKNISGNENQIGVFTVDFGHQPLHLMAAGVVSQV